MWQSYFTNENTACSPGTGYKGTFSVFYPYKHRKAVEEQVIRGQCSIHPKLYRQFTSNLGVVFVQHSCTVAGTFYKKSERQPPQWSGGRQVMKCKGMKSLNGCTGDWLPKNQQAIWRSIVVHILHCEPISHETKQNILGDGEGARKELKGESYHLFSSRLWKSGKMQRFFERAKPTYYLFLPVSSPRKDHFFLLSTPKQNHCWFVWRFWLKAFDYKPNFIGTTHILNYLSKCESK